MSAWAATVLAWCYREACTMDVVAHKPGNVSLTSPGHGMRANDFIRSAHASASRIVRPGAPLGERIQSAAEATQAAVGCNTNLGILLLCAPLLKAREEHPKSDLRAGVQQVLDTTTLADADAVYAAVRLAAPAGLGTRDEHDVAQRAQLRLTDAMRVAAEEDMIARQYANGFAELLGEAVPCLEQAIDRQTDRARALTELYLELLARFPDTHIRRKQGADAATRVMSRAREVKRQLDAAPSQAAARRPLRDFDRELKESGCNPGTTADFCVAALLSHRLQHLAEVEPGVTRKYPRTWSPEVAESATKTQ